MSETERRQREREREREREQAINESRRRGPYMTNSIVRPGGEINEKRSRKTLGGYRQHKPSKLSLYNIQNPGKEHGNRGNWISLVRIAIWLGCCIFKAGRKPSSNDTAIVSFRSHHHIAVFLEDLR